MQNGRYRESSRSRGARSWQRQKVRRSTDGAPSRAEVAGPERHHPGGDWTVGNQRSTPRSVRGFREPGIVERNCSLEGKSRAGLGWPRSHPECQIAIHDKDIAARDSVGRTGPFPWKGVRRGAGIDPQAGLACHRGLATAPCARREASAAQARRPLHRAGQRATTRNALARG